MIWILIIAGVFGVFRWVVLEDSKNWSHDEEGI